MSLPPHKLLVGLLLTLSLTAAAPPESLQRPEQVWIERSTILQPHDGPGCRVLPAFRAGRLVGFKLFGAVHAGLRLRQVGLENGDTLLSIGPHEMTSPDAALEAFHDLRSACGVDVRFERAGVVRELRWEIFDAGPDDGPCPRVQCL